MMKLISSVFQQLDSWDFLDVWRDFSEWIKLNLGKCWGRPCTSTSQCKDSLACMYRWTLPLSITIDQSNLSESVAWFRLLSSEMLYRHIIFKGWLVLFMPSRQMLFPCLLTRTRHLMVLLQLMLFWTCLGYSPPKFIMHTICDRVH